MLLELCRLRVAYLLDCESESAVRHRVARDAGVSEAKISCIADGPRGEAFDARERGTTWSSVSTEVSGMPLRSTGAAPQYTQAKRSRARMLRRLSFGPVFTRTNCTSDTTAGQAISNYPQGDETELTALLGSVDALPFEDQASIEATVAALRGDLQDRGLRLGPGCGVTDQN